VRVRSWRRDEAERAIAWLESAEHKMRHYNLTVYSAPRLQAIPRSPLFLQMTAIFCIF